MNKFRLLIVENEDVLIEQYKESIELYNYENKESIEFIVECAQTIEEAFKKINTMIYDGAMIDLKLDNLRMDEAKGNSVISKLKEKFRIPLAICTGFAGDLESDIKKNQFMRVFIKGNIDND